MATDTEDMATDMDMTEDPTTTIMIEKEPLVEDMATDMEDMATDMDMTEDPTTMTTIENVPLVAVCKAAAIGGDLGDVPTGDFR